MSTASFRIACYNVLAPVYAVKHKQQEGLTPEGSDNWFARWPALARAISSCPCDIMCMLELGRKGYSSAAEDIRKLAESFTPPFQMLYFDHPWRKDAVAILYAEERFEFLQMRTTEHHGNVTPLVDLRDRATGAVVRVLAFHQFHPKDSRHPGHLGAALSLAEQGELVDCTVIAGDFNEDPRQSSLQKQVEFVRQYRCAVRCSCPHLPQVSTSKVPAEPQLDWIWVRGAEPEYDDFCQHVIRQSHKPCPETGMWPSDHGMEAVRCTISRLRRSLGFLLPPAEGEAVLFQNESGAAGGVGAFVLKRLAERLPGETLRRVPADRLHAVLAPQSWLTALAATTLPRPVPGGPWCCTWTGFGVAEHNGQAHVVATFELQDTAHQASLQAYLQGFGDACGRGTEDIELHVPIIRTSATCATLRPALAQLGTVNLPRESANGHRGFEITEMQVLRCIDTAP